MDQETASSCPGCGQHQWRRDDSGIAVCPDCGTSCVWCSVPKDLQPQHPLPLLLAQVLDEITVERMLRSSPPESLQRFEELTLGGADKRRKNVQVPVGRFRGWMPQRIESLLNGGPLWLHEISAAVHGDPADEDEKRLNAERTRKALARMERDGRVKHVGRGYYALPHRTDDEQYRKADDCYRLLLGRRARPLTVREIADRLDVVDNTVHTWLGRLRQLGHQVRKTKRAGLWVFWIEPQAEQLQQPTAGLKVRQAERAVRVA